MSFYQATDWQPEGPYIPSRQEFKGVSGSSFKVGRAVEFDTSAGTNGYDSDDHKYWVKPYATSDSTAKAVGVVMYNLPASGLFDSNDPEYAGLDWRTRDIKLALLGGPIPMLNKGTGNTVVNMKVAPTISGFKDHESGETVLGKCMQQGVPTGEFAMIYIDIGDAEA